MTFKKEARDTGMDVIYYWLGALCFIISGALILSMVMSSGKGDK